MSFFNKTYLLLIAFFPAFSVIAQNTDTHTEKLKIKIETAGTFSDGDHTPFWLTSNNHGISSQKTNNQYLRVGAFADRKVFNNQLGISLGIDAIVANNLQSDFYFHQIYADFKYKILGLSIGSKERGNLFKNKELSSGGMTLSDNARPIPQIEAGFPEFVAIPFTNEYLHVRGGVSYGRFFDDKYNKHHNFGGNYTEDILYHKKYIFLKLEKNYPFSFIIGMEMDTQWGGKRYINGKFYEESPASFKNFFKVLVPMSGGGDANHTDQVNVLGNVYGSWHFILNYKQKDYSIKAYHEHFFEDHSGIIFKNIPDGLYGIEFNLHKKLPVSSLLFEYVHTKNQSAPFLWDETSKIPVQVSGGDNYYNHDHYQSSSNYKMVLGNPLLTSPIYNLDTFNGLLNNRIISFHGGIGGYITDDLKYRALFTYTRSWGTPVIPAKHIRNQFSSMLEMTYTNHKLPGWLFAGAFAYDDAKTMVGDNLGFRLKVTKTFHVR